MVLIVENDHVRTVIKRLAVNTVDLHVAALFAQPDPGIIQR